MKEQFEFIFKPSSKQKTALRKFLQGQDLLVNLPTGFPAKKIMRFRAKKNYTHVANQVQAFRRKPKKLRLFSRNEKA